MNARTPVYREVTLAAIVLAFGLPQVGCTQSDPEPDPNATAYAASGGVPAQAASDPNQSPRSSETAGPSETQQPDDPTGYVSAQQPPDSAQVPDAIAGAESEPTRLSAADQMSRTQPAGGEQDPSTETATPFAIEGGGASSVPQRELRADLSPEKLLEFLSGADQDMQVIVTGRSGIKDPREARDTLIHIVKMKLEASRRLSKHADSSDQAQSEGKRGELQSLSHLAALGDLKSAEELERLANDNLKSSDASLVADSRLVLIGFAIESLQNGKEEAADQIVQYVKQIAESETKPDVPALMVMGQARQTLADYGHDDKARAVRDTIIDLFAGATDPEVAQMAAQLAGNVRFDAIEQLRVVVMDGETVAPARWREAVETLIDESADLQTVQYLAGAALEFESLGANELSDATYQMMAKRFDDPDSATGREVKLAIAAGQARRDVIGRVFDPDLPQVDGSPLSMADFKGKVVVMPFWATGFPESLQLISRLKSIRDAHPDQVTIVGMNLDTEGAPLEKFLETSDLGFPSFRAESSPTAKVANPVAAQFGMVSMPFTAILDQKGRVAAIDFTGRDLEATVEELIDR